MDHDTASFYYEVLHILSKHSKTGSKLNTSRFKSWWRGECVWGGVRREAGVQFKQMDGWNLLAHALQFNSPVAVVELMLSTWPEAVCTRNAPSPSTPIPMMNHPNHISSHAHAFDACVLLTLRGMRMLFSFEGPVKGARR